MHPDKTQPVKGEVYIRQCLCQEMADPLLDANGIIKAFTCEEMILQPKTSIQEEVISGVHRSKDHLGKNIPLICDILPPWQLTNYAKVGKKSIRVWRSGSRNLEVSSCLTIIDNWKVEAAAPTRPSPLLGCLQYASMGWSNSGGVRDLQA